MDFSYLISISDGDSEFISQFISTFRSNTGTILAGMENSLASKDYETLKRQAHQLKPSLEMLKLETFETCLQIQHEPETASPESLNKIREECEAAIAQMNTEFNL